MIRSDDILRIIESLKDADSNLTITTIGYNNDHNAILLKDLATTGGGSYNIVNNQEEVASVFGDILGGLMTTTAQNVVVNYPSSWNCINIYTKKENNNIISLSIGDVNAESETIILFENTDNNDVVVKGFSTKDFGEIVKIIKWNTEILSNDRIAYIVSYIRNGIAYILANMNNRDMIRPKISIIKSYLSEPIIQYHPLIPFLVQEINSIEVQLNNGINLNQTSNLQTSAFLALGRGTSQYQTPVRIHRVRRRLSFSGGEDDEDILVNSMNNINIQTPFSNRIQQELTQQMLNLTQPTNVDMDT